MTRPAVREIESYLKTAIAGYNDDPADNDFQRGYLAALVDVWAELFLNEADRRLLRARSPDGSLN